MIKPIYKKTFILIIIIFLIIFLSNFLYFKNTILSLNSYAYKKANNIVILTGGTNRIKEGLKIINNFNKFDLMKIKLLISGTGKGFTKLDINRVFSKDNSLDIFIKCCLDLDGQSHDTYSNAVETLKWTNNNNIKAFILVTSNYHMPRALLEFTTQMPDLNIIPHSTTPKRHNISNWMYSFETFSLLLLEYFKFLLANIRIKILNLKAFD